jgi:diaminobutyrate-2-oxoglutarate transaminase
LESNNRSYPRSIPLVFDVARGAVVQDVDGNRFIDFFSGCGVLNLGHNNPKILDDVRCYEGNIMQSVDLATEAKINFIQRIFSLLPNGLRNKSKINFGGPTGSDAIEQAIKLARINTGRHSIIAFQGGYHGMTAGALSVSSKLKHRADATPLIPGVHFMPYCNCYRCSFDLDHRKCKMECFRYFKNSIENPHSGIDKPAAIILEPVQGEGGTNIPRNGWLEKITHVARKNGILIIFDEIQAGFFRTGKLFSFEHTNAVPDIIAMSKGVGGIGFPLSFIIYDKQLDTWTPGTHIGTFRGNQLGMVAGASAMKLIIEEHVEQHVVSMGADILATLRDIQKEHLFIGDVRGIGMMFGIEYVSDRKTKRPFPEMAKVIRKLCYEMGLLVEVGGLYDNVVRFLPPLILTSELMKNGMAIFRKANTKALNRLEGLAVNKSATQYPMATLS